VPEPGSRSSQRPLGGSLHQRVLCCGHDDEFVTHPGLDLQPGPVAGALDQAQVHVQRFHGLAHLARVGDLQVHAQVRLAARQVREHSRQRIGAYGGAGCHAQTHGQAGGPHRKRLLYAPGLLQQRQRLGQQGAPRVVERQPPAHALEQLGAHGLLQLLQRGAGGRLRQGHGIGRRHGGAGLGNGAEDFKLAQGEMQHGKQSGRGINLFPRLMLQKLFVIRI